MVSMSVRLNVLNKDWRKSMAERVNGLVSSEYTFAWGANSLGGGDELILELSLGSLCLDHLYDFLVLDYKFSFFVSLRFTCVIWMNYLNNSCARVI